MTRNVDTRKYEQAWDQHPHEVVGMLTRLADEQGVDIQDFLADSDIITRDIAIDRLKDDVRDDLVDDMGKQEADQVHASTEKLQQLATDPTALWDDSECDDEVVPLRKEAFSSLVHDLQSIHAQASLEQVKGHVHRAWQGHEVARAIHIGYDYLRQLYPAEQGTDFALRYGYTVRPEIKDVLQGQIADDAEQLDGINGTEDITMYLGMVQRDHDALQIINQHPDTYIYTKPGQLDVPQGRMDLTKGIPRPIAEHDFMKMLDYFYDDYRDDDS